MWLLDSHLYRLPDSACSLDSKRKPNDLRFPKKQKATYGKGFVISEEYSGSVKN